MSYIKNDRARFYRWRDCDRCGLPWPEHTLVRQRGALVCEECFDEPSHEDFVLQGQPSQEPNTPPWESDE